MIHLSSRAERARTKAIQTRNALYADRKVKEVAPKCNAYCGKDQHKNCPFKLKELRA